MASKTQIWNQQVGSKSWSEMSDEERVAHSLFFGTDWAKGIDTSADSYMGSRDGITQQEYNAGQGLFSQLSSFGQENQLSLGQPINQPNLVLPSPSANTQQTQSAINPIASNYQQYQDYLQEVENQNTLVGALANEDLAYVPGGGSGGESQTDRLKAARSRAYALGEEQGLIDPATGQFLDIGFDYVYDGLRVNTTGRPGEYAARVDTDKYGDMAPDLFKDLLLNIATSGLTGAAGLSGAEGIRNPLDPEMIVNLVQGADSYEPQPTEEVPPEIQQGDVVGPGGLFDISVSPSAGDIVEELPPEFDPTGDIELDPETDEPIVVDEETGDVTVGVPELPEQEEGGGGGGADAGGGGGGEPAVYDTEEEYRQAVEAWRAGQPDLETATAKEIRQWEDSLPSRSGELQKAYDEQVAQAIEEAARQDDEDAFIDTGSNYNVIGRTDDGGYRVEDVATGEVFVAYPDPTVESDVRYETDIPSDTNEGLAGEEGEAPEQDVDEEEPPTELPDGYEWVFNPESGDWELEQVEEPAEEEGPVLVPGYTSDVFSTDPFGDTTADGTIDGESVDAGMDSGSDGVDAGDGSAGSDGGGDSSGGELVVGPSLPDAGDGEGTGGTGEGDGGDGEGSGTQQPLPASTAFGSQLEFNPFQAGISYDVPMLTRQNIALRNFLAELYARG